MTTEDTGPPKVPDNIKGHVAWHRLNEQIEWYDTKSGSNQFWYKWLKVAQLILAAMIPVVAIVDAPLGRWISAALGVLILVLEGVQQLWQFSSLWITYRSTAEQLKHEKYLVLAQAGPYSGLDTDAALKMLAERVEEQVSTEHAKWVSETRAVEQHIRP